MSKPKLTSILFYSTEKIFVQNDFEYVWPFWNETYFETSTIAYTFWTQNILTRQNGSQDHFPTAPRRAMVVTRRQWPHHQASSVALSGAVSRSVVRCSHWKKLDTRYPGHRSVPGSDRHVSTRKMMPGQGTQWEGGREKWVSRLDAGPVPWTEARAPTLPTPPTPRSISIS